MVRIGIVGIGFMGVTHYRAVKEVEGAEVVAICTRSPKKLHGDWTDVRGNFGEAGGVEDVSHLRRYDKISDILNDPEIDLIDICLPTSLHYETTISAFEASKHVLLEKPIALNLKHADAMVEAAKKADRFFMVGQVLRFFPEFAFLKEAIEGRKYGALLGAHFKRIISKPTWSEENWFADPARSGGAVIDLHIHDADFIQYILGMPDRVFSSGVVSPDGYVDHLATQYLYGERNLCITAEGGWMAMPGLLFEHGFDVYFETATLQYNSLWEVPLTVFPADGEKTHPELPAQDGFVAEIQYGVDCIRENREPEVISGASARNSLLLCLKESQSAKSRRTVRIPER